MIESNYTFKRATEKQCRYLISTCYTELRQSVIKEHAGNQTPTFESRVENDET